MGEAFRSYLCAAASAIVKSLAVGQSWNKRAAPLCLGIRSRDCLSFPWMDGGFNNRKLGDSWAAEDRQKTAAAAINDAKPDALRAA